jgi:hypothetical protein
MTDIRTLQAVDGLPTDPATRDRHWVTQIEPRLISGRRFMQRTSTMSVPRTGV